MDGRTDGYLWMGPSIEHLTVLINPVGRGYKGEILMLAYYEGEILMLAYEHKSLYILVTHIKLALEE